MTERNDYSPASVRRKHQFLFSLQYDIKLREGKPRSTFYPRPEHPEITPNPQYICEPKEKGVIVYESENITASS